MSRLAAPCGWSCINALTVPATNDFLAILMYGPFFSLEEVVVVNGPIVSACFVEQLVGAYAGFGMLKTMFGLRYIPNIRSVGSTPTLVRRHGIILDFILKVCS